MLGANEIHVWAIEPPGGSALSARAERVLPSDERARAGEIGSGRGRTRFLRERILLREILARYVDGAPVDLRFERDRRGKPHLARGHTPAVEFSLSDSGEQVWIAVGRCGPIGLDIERIRRGVDVDGLAERFFASDEAAALAALPAGERVDGFFRAWVQKEAYLKALGGGVPIRLPRFSVRIGGVAAILRTQIEAGGGTGYRLYDLEAPCGYVAALAAPGEGHTVRFANR